MKILHFSWAKGKKAQRPYGNIAATVRFFGGRIQGRGGRVGPEAPIAEGGPVASAGGTDGTGSPGGRGPPCRLVDIYFRSRKN